MNRQASITAKTAALMMMAPTLLMPFEVAAQQMAAVSPAACDAIKDPAKSAQCHWDAEGAALKARTAAAQARGAAADREGQCSDLIKAEVTAGRIKVEALRDKLAGRPAREVGACNLLAALTKS